MQTLGDVITFVLGLVGVILIPYLALRAWVFPHIRTIWRFVMSHLTPISVKHSDDNILSSNAEPGSVNRYELSPNYPASSDAHQIEADQKSMTDLIYELTERPFNREEVLTLIARVKNVGGEHWFSANKISGFVGGTNADNMAIIAAHRPRKETPIRRSTPGTLRRPSNGW